MKKIVVVLLSLVFVFGCNNKQNTSNLDDHKINDANSINNNGKVSTNNNNELSLEDSESVNNIDTIANPNLSIEHEVDNCNQYKDEKLKSDCINNENYNKIVGNGDINKCKELGYDELQLNCESSIIISQALIANDLGLCNSIKNDESLNYCKYNIIIQNIDENGDIKACSDLDEYYSKLCIENFNQMQAIKNQKIKFCENNKDIESIKNCKNNYYFQIALDKNDKNICNQIQEEYLKQSCLESF